MTSATNRDPGIGPATGGDRNHGNSSENQTAGSGEPGDRSGTNGGNRRAPKSAAEQRVRWVGIASAIATVVFLLAQMYGTLTGNKKLSEDIQSKIPTTGQIEQLGNAVGDLQDSVNEIPDPTQTTIIQKGEAGKPGQPGQPGQAGQVKIVKTAPNTVVITTTTAAPVPRATSTPPIKPSPVPTSKPQPTCSTSLFGTCIIP